MMIHFALVRRVSAGTPSVPGMTASITGTVHNPATNDDIPSTSCRYCTTKNWIAPAMNTGSPAPRETCY
ncbi:hypothetical protein A8926_4988 [Saccharopolyspora spinosa]|uniref:Uncharacterized protein n=1 Tax=Saccharopolyspora spinosa TaxID=60894 RepID=A0A2N3Y2I8_SACSN|nr:hypothetical protein A8926_4988 [Saccharopolyspora spinosa]